MWYVEEVDFCDLFIPNVVMDPFMLKTLDALTPLITQPSHEPTYIEYDPENPLINQQIVKQPTDDFSHQLSMCETQPHVCQYGHCRCRRDARILDYAQRVYGFTGSMNVRDAMRKAEAKRIRLCDIPSFIARSVRYDEAVATMRLATQCQCCVRHQTGRPGMWVT
jgi:hypothetical protein